MGDNKKIMNKADLARLDEIENKFNPYEAKWIDPDDIEWLITQLRRLDKRVGRLEAALSDIAENDAHYDPPFRIARKALEVDDE